MDFVKKIVGDSKGEDKTSQSQGQQEGSSGGFMDKLNSVAGGGKESEKNEDALDKGMLPLSPRLVRGLPYGSVSLVVDWALIAVIVRRRLGAGTCPWPGRSEQRERR